MVSLAETYWQIFLCQSVAFGIGMGLVFSECALTLPDHVSDSFARVLQYPSAFYLLSTPFLSTEGRIRHGNRYGGKLTRWHLLSK